MGLVVSRRSGRGGRNWRCRRQCSGVTAILLLPVWLLPLRTVPLLRTALPPGLEWLQLGTRLLVTNWAVVVSRCRCRRDNRRNLESDFLIGSRGFRCCTVASVCGGGLFPTWGSVFFPLVSYHSHLDHGAIARPDGGEGLIDELGS